MIVMHAIRPMLDLVFGVGALAWPFLFAIALVAPAAALSSIKRGRADYAFLFAVFVAAMIAVLLARSVAAFLLAWEGMTLTSAFLIAAHHERRFVRRAVFSYVVMSQLGTLCILASFALLGVHAGSFWFDGIARAAAALPAPTRLWVLALALVGFGSKAGLVPLHFWLPRAHPAAPGDASAVLSGLMLAVAVYGLVQTSLILAAPAPAAFALVVVAAGLVTALAGGLYAAVDADIKRLLAYSSIENIGVVVSALGLSLLAVSLGNLPVAAAALIALLFHTIAHAVFKSLLFLVAGNVSAACGTTDLEHLGGLVSVLRFTAPLALVGCLAAAALPPTNGFASEWLVFHAFIQALLGGAILLRATAAISIAALATGAGLAALAYVKLLGIGFLGTQRSGSRIAVERFDPSVGGLAWLALAAVAFGLFPMLLIRPLETVAAAVVGFGALNAGALPALPAGLAALPIAGALCALLYAAKRTRHVPTWTCGSPAAHRGQYTATAFAKPIGTVFKKLLLPARERIIDSGSSAWFPRAISYVTSVRYVPDEIARSFAGVIQRTARRTRIVQGGLLRVYLAYAVLALVAALAAAR